jgi:hypothetical protein
MSFRQACQSVKVTPRDGTTAQLFSSENQAGGLKLFNSGRHPAWAALATGTARVRWKTAFRIFRWLEVADFDLVFLFLFLRLCFHVFPISSLCLAFF